MELQAAELAAIVGITSALIGTVGGKLFDNYMQRKKLTVDVSSQIRSEQQAEIFDLREELSATESKLDQWREKFFELKSENITQQALIENLQDQIDALKKAQ